MWACERAVFVTAGLQNAEKCSSGRGCASSSLLVRAYFVELLTGTVDMHMGCVMFSGVIVSAIWLQFAAICILFSLCSVVNSMCISFLLVLAVWQRLFAICKSLFKFVCFQCCMHGFGI